MMIRFQLSAAIAIVLSVVAGSAEVLSCEGVPVTVIASNVKLAQQACDGATRAVQESVECGVILSRPQSIEVKDAIPQHSDCMGIYHCGENRIEVLSPKAIERVRREEGAFHVIPAEIYFGSVLAHELAHAAYDAVPCPYPNCLVTSEYVAYVMQVYSLPPELRKAFEAEAPMENKVSRYDINTITLFMDPNRFARNAWAHFSQREDGCAYVAEMMRGNFYLDSERP